MNPSFAVGLLLFAVVWSLLTLALDRLMGYDFYRQIRTTSYPSVSGVITHSEVNSETDDFGTKYDVAVKYKYQVGSMKYTCDTYRHGQFITSDETPAREFVKQHPPGAKVTVYYDPENPDDAVLYQGIRGMNFMLVLIMTLTNLVAVGSSVAATRALLRRVWPRPAGGVPILRRPYGVHLRLPRFSWLAQAAAITLLILFASLWTVVLGMRCELPAAGLLLVWGILIAANAGFYYWKQIRAGKGLDDLVIDFERKVFSLPQTYGRDGAEEYPLSGFRRVEVENEIVQTKDSSYTTYTPTLVFTDSHYRRRREPLIAWQEPFRAESLAEWLNERMMPKEEES